MSRKKKSNEQLEKEVMKSVSTVVGFIKDHVTNRLVEASNKKLITVDTEDLKKVNTILSSLIDEAFVKSSGEIINTLRNQ